MRYFLCCFMLGLLSFGLMVNEASAKRFGGGRSFGVQRSQSSLFSSNKSQNTSFMGQKSNKSRWGGLLGGMLIGGLLASLFMGNGLFNGLMTWLILGSILFFVISFIKRKMHPGWQSSQSHPWGQNTFNNHSKPQASNNYHFVNSSQQPADLISESFLRNAKVTFIRLQTAYDQKNYQDIKIFTTPEVYAEIKMQLDEREDEINKTEVIQLNAELLDMSKQTLSTIASVRFTGSIKENDEAAIPLDEIWHFYQFTNSKDWVVGGIQHEVYQP